LIGITGPSVVVQKPTFVQVRLFLQLVQGESDTLCFSFSNPISII